MSKKGGLDVKGSCSSVYVMGVMTEAKLDKPFLLLALNIAQLIGYAVEQKGHMVKPIFQLHWDRCEGVCSGGKGLGVGEGLREKG